MSQPPSTSLTPTARRIAKTILNGFDAYFADFQNMTLGAKARFETANWQAVHKAHYDRIELYKTKVDQVCELVRGVTSKNINDIAIWRQARNAYAQLVQGHINYEIAETFFNSIFCCIFQHAHIHDRNLFVKASRPIEDKPVKEYSIYLSYTLDNGTVDMASRILDDFEFSVPWEDKKRDVANIVSVVEEQILPLLNCPLPAVRIDMLESVFYRNKGAYLVGRAVQGQHYLPILLPLLNSEQGGIYVDSVIFEPDDVSIIFSFTRSYFMVDAPIPSRFVRFLNSLMPKKKRSEIYNAIGFNKHGKTEFYRQLLEHMKNSNDKFTIAPGIKGMVMSVFTLPSYGIVFKIIKDKFDPPKTVTETMVRAQYKFVSRSDRAGRMADTQEYSNFIFYRNRFDEELLLELQKVAPSKLILTDRLVIIRHLYTERRMVPLNLYLQTASEAETYSVMDEYGNAIKQLAAANIFTGDMLLKNFGVTRHGRVVFYDYDEIMPLTDCHFRKIPLPRTEFDEMADRPWYTVADNDVFPEEFRLFFTGNPVARKAFEERHSDLYDYRYWIGIQDALRAGHVQDTFPYRRQKRFEGRDENGGQL